MSHISLNSLFALPNVTCDLNRHHYLFLTFSDEVRGIPASNWVKFRNPSTNTENALFIYKTVHRCNHLSPRHESWLYDAVSQHAIENRDQKGARKGDQSFVTRSAIGPKLAIHSVTTRLAEVYLVQPLANMTTHFRSESDIRIIPIPEQCQSSIASFISISTLPKFIFTGSYLQYGTNWKEFQFLSVVDENFSPLTSWTLFDADINQRKKKQKNWLAFWEIEKCRLLLSKRFAPIHEVGEFHHWSSSTGSEVDIASIATSESPAKVPADTFIRGSAPPIKHPNLHADLVIGCVHVKGKHKVYRHALYIQQAVSPYKILSYSALFTFHPLRNIEFVMSLFVADNGALQLTHGSADCEPRLTLFPVDRLKEEFHEYFEDI